MHVIDPTLELYDKPSVPEVRSANNDDEDKILLFQCLYINKIKTS